MITTHIEYVWDPGRVSKWNREKAINRKCTESVIYSETDMVRKP